MNNPNTVLQYVDEILFLPKRDLEFNVLNINAPYLSYINDSICLSFKGMPHISNTFSSNREHRVIMLSGE